MVVSTGVVLDPAARAWIWANPDCGRATMIKSILVPVDGSVHAAKAVAFAGELAHALGASLTLLHVIEEPRRVVAEAADAGVPDDLWSEPAASEHHDHVDRLRAIATELLDGAEQIALSKGAVQVRRTIETGDVAERITDIAILRCATA